jgi:hypothetical protein
MYFSDEKVKTQRSGFRDSAGFKHNDNGTRLRQIEAAMVQNSLKATKGCMLQDTCNAVTRRQGQWCCAGHRHPEGMRGYATTWLDKATV